MLNLETLLLISIVTFNVFGQDCPIYQFSFGGACFDSCPSNTVENRQASVMECQECDITKFFVVSRDQSKCQCALQTYYVGELDQCLPCHYSCLTCSGPSSSECLTCKSPAEKSFREMSGTSCLCPPGYFDDGISLKCQACHTDCLTCTGPADTDCIDCARKREKNDVNQCICSRSFVQDQSGNCTCPLPLAIVSGTCQDPVTSCGFNEQLTATTTKIRNVASAAKTSGTCACKKGTVKIKGKCDTCSTNQIYNDQKKKCQCDPKGFKHKKQCIVCPTDQKFNKRTGECECKKNSFKTETGTCTSCPAKSYYSQGSCICNFNFYQAQNGKCRKCTKKADNPACQDATHHIDRPRKLNLSQI